MAEKNKDIQVPQVQGTADIFRGIMVSLYVKGKENGESGLYEMKQHIQSTENIH
ncbi:MAG: hypothetical protein SO096_02300 [Prevotella sp.]|nr:hypothetical protein [Prevotella sp.]